MPTAQVELNNRDESLHRVVYVGDGQKHLWVRHEAAEYQSVHSVPCVAFPYFHPWDLGQSFVFIKASGLSTHFVMRSSMLRGSRMKVGSTTRLRSAPGRSWEMMWVRTKGSPRSSALMPSSYGHGNGEKKHSAKFMAHHFPDQARRPRRRPA